MLRKKGPKIILITLAAVSVGLALLLAFPPTAKYVRYYAQRLPYILTTWTNGVRNFVGAILPVDLIPVPESVLVGAGDITICGSDGDDATADLLDAYAAQYPNLAIFAVGDVSNGSGAPVEYQECFDETWGRHKELIYPAPGNHDYTKESGYGQAYFDYFGAAAGDPELGYYSYDLGSWHILSLNSNCEMLDGCGPDSKQVAWMIADLKAHPTRCALAYWHHPRWSSNEGQSDPTYAPFFDVLYEYGVDIVISGHHHAYERLEPQDPQGNFDPQRGVRQFVVGTGGDLRRERFVRTPVPNSAFRYDESIGLLKLILYADRYSWEFVTASGGVRDPGEAVCTP